MRTLLLVLALLAAGPAGAAPFLVKDGRAQAEIVLGTEPARTAKLAAEELQTYVRKISGAELPIVTAPTPGCPVQVYVGRSAHTDRLKVSDDGLLYGAFRIVAGPNWLVLLGRDRDLVPREPWARSHEDRHRVLKEWDAFTGEKWGNPMLSVHRRRSPKLGIFEGDERGSLNAVYEFLRGLGARWYFPGDLGEVLPKLADIPLPKGSRTVRPDFPVRHLFFYFHEFWQATEKNPEGVDDVFWQMRLGLFAYPEVMGYSVGHGTVPVHSREEVRLAHPEYYALWGGKRQTIHFNGTGAPCLSSEGLFRANVKYVRAVFDLYQEPMISVAPADGYVDLCQCDLCKGKGTPERGWYGQLSDYVWSYVDRVAAEVRKTHPDRKISCIAYGAYQLPPTKIARLSPNLAVIICRSRADLQTPEARRSFEKLVKEWREKIPSKEIYIWEYYLHARPEGAWAGVPVYYPHAIAADLRFLKGISRGEHVEVYRNYPPEKRPWDALAANHLNCYVTARLYWDADQDVDALLAEYYDRFYGPAAKQMKAFVDYSEANWPRATKDVAVIDRMLALLDAARQAAGDTVYGRRVDLLVQYTDRLRQLRERLARGREGAPEVRVREGRDPAGPKLDGRLDEPFWQDLPAYPLREVETGRPAHHGTSFKMAWANGALYLGVFCSDRDMEHLNDASRRADDTNVWNGDNVELLLETQTHSYYQIAFSPSGLVTDLDRRKGMEILWSSGAQAAASAGEEGWSLEVRIPVAGEGAADLDPLHGVAGRKPSKTYPWYFNLCRQRIRDRGKELTAFSPTGKPLFHDPLKFGVLYVP